MAGEPMRDYSHVATVETAAVDVGLRRYMLQVYNYMASALALTGIVALLIASSPAALRVVTGTPLMWVFLFAPIGIALYFGLRLRTMSPTTAQVLFWTFAAIFGAALAPIFLAYTGDSIARTFFVTAGAFAGLSLWGYTTRRDLSGMGSFLIMGLIGLIIASLVNLFLQSSAMQWIISVVGVLVFSGLTAYDTQKIKESYWADDDGATVTKKAVFGALTLYLDFVNLFLYLLRFMGAQRN